METIAQIWDDFVINNSVFVFMWGPLLPIFIGLIWLVSEERKQGSKVAIEILLGIGMLIAAVITGWNIYEITPDLFATSTEFYGNSYELIIISVLYFGPLITVPAIAAYYCYRNRGGALKNLALGTGLLSVALLLSVICLFVRTLIYENT